MRLGGAIVHRSDVQNWINRWSYRRPGILCELAHLSTSISFQGLCFFQPTRNCLHLRQPAGHVVRQLFLCGTQLDRLLHGVLQVRPDQRLCVRHAHRSLCPLGLHRPLGTPQRPAGQREGKWRARRKDKQDKERVSDGHAAKTSRTKRG